MKCPHCGEDENLVYRTDDSSYLPHIRRARLCRSCRLVFETMERATGDAYFKRKPAAMEPTLFDETLEKAEQHANLNRVKREIELLERKGQ